MHSVIALALALSASCTCSAGEAAQPLDVAGQYVHFHYVRDWIGQCPDGNPSRCPQVKVADTVLITKEADGFGVNVNLTADDLHVCEYTGVGKLHGRSLIASGIGAADGCTVIIAFTKNRTLRLTSKPQQACAMICGTNARLHAEGLSKQVASQRAK